MSLTSAWMACRGASVPLSMSADRRIAFARPKKASSTSVGDAAQAGWAIAIPSATARTATMGLRWVISC